MKGVLLVNLGSPESTDPKDVKKYLGEFNGRLLILYGDMPLIKEETIKKIVNNTSYRI